MMLSLFAVIVAFSPGSAEAEVIRAVNASRHTLDIAAYSFTSSPIAAAIEAAAKRGVIIRAVVDDKHRGEKGSIAPRVAAAGGSVRFDAVHAIQHDKFMVIDGSTVETGSFNYTYSAAHSNAENVVILSDPVVTGAYSAEFMRHWAHSAQ